DCPFHEHPGESRTGGRNLRVEHGDTSERIGTGSGTGVETEPANPQKGSADDRQDEIMRSHIRVAVTIALADDEGSDQTGNTGVNMNDRTACKIKHPIRRHEATA